MIKEEHVANAKISYEFITILSFDFQVKNINEKLSLDIFKNNLYLLNKQLEENNRIIKKVEINEKNKISIYVIKEALEKIETQEFLTACETFIKEYLGLPKIEASSSKLKYFEKLESLEYFREKTNLLDNKLEKNFKKELKDRNLLD